MVKGRILVVEDERIIAKDIENTLSGIGYAVSEVRISDTGTGIPKEVQPRIFDPFFTTKKVGKGTGQGLAIAHSVIAEKHGGTITFDTEVGKGTTFIIRLPMEAKAQDPR